MATWWLPKPTVLAEFINNDKQQINFLLQENEEFKRKFIELSQATIPRSQINMINEDRIKTESTNHET